MRLTQMLQLAVTTSLHLPVLTRNYRAIKVLIDPIDLDLYRAVLPAPLGMPAVPKLLFELSEVSPSWHEGILSIACRHGGREGWHGVYWAIDSYFPCVFGRLYGYPKFMADTMTLSRLDYGWLGRVEHEGREQLKINFSSGGSGEAAAEIKTPSEEKPFFLQCPAQKGPYINRLTYFEVTSPRITCTPGMAHVTFRDQGRFDGLLPRDGASGPAQLIEKIGLNLGFLYSLRLRRPRQIEG